MKIKVREKDMTAEVHPSENAVKNADANTPNPIIKKAMEYNEKPYKAIWKTLLSFVVKSSKAGRTASLISILEPIALTIKNKRLFLKILRS